MVCESVVGGIPPCGSGIDGSVEDLLVGRLMSVGRWVGGRWHVVSAGFVIRREKVVTKILKYLADFSCYANFILKRELLW